jgi:hypothetical protein
MKRDAGSVALEERVTGVINGRAYGILWLEEGICYLSNIRTIVLQERILTAHLRIIANGDDALD